MTSDSPPPQHFPPAGTQGGCGRRFSCLARRTAEVAITAIQIAPPPFRFDIRYRGLSPKVIDTSLISARMIRTSRTSPTLAVASESWIASMCSTVFPLLCDFSPLKLTSGTYGRQLEAKLFGGGRQASDALLAVAVFVCICAFVEVGLAPSQQPVNQSSQLPSGGEYGNVAAEPLR